MASLMNSSPLAGSSLNFFLATCAMLLPIRAFDLLSTSSETSTSVTV